MWRSGVRRPRVCLASRLPGGPGAPPYRHYDRCAGEPAGPPEQGSLRAASAARGPRSLRAPHQIAAMER